MTITPSGQAAELARRIAEDVLPYMERIGAGGEGYTADHEIALQVVKQAAAHLARARAEAMEACASIDPPTSETHLMQAAGFTSGWARAVEAYRSAIRALSRAESEVPAAVRARDEEGSPLPQMVAQRRAQLEQEARSDSGSAGALQMREALERYRECFDELTAKAAPYGDGEDVKLYVIPAGPLHRAAGKLGHQAFNVGKHLERMKSALDKIASLTFPSIAEGSSDCASEMRSIARAALSSATEGEGK